MRCCERPMGLYPPYRLPTWNANGAVLGLPLKQPLAVVTAVKVKEYFSHVSWC